VVSNPVQRTDYTTPAAEPWTKDTNTPNQHV